MRASEVSLRTRRFGVFEVDLRAAELRKHGIRIKLQEQPFQILVLLLEHQGDLVTREEIRQALWPAQTFVDFDRSLNKAMTKLRSALGDSAESPRYIETVHRHGYRFLVPVSTQSENGTEHIAEDRKNGSNNPSPSLSSPLAYDEKLSATNNLPADSQDLPPSDHQKHGNLAIIVGSILATTLVALFVFYLRSVHPTVFGGSTGSINPRRSVAVLGFRNLSGDPQEAWLSTAFADWLTTELSAGEQLRTLPGESIARMKMELALPEVDNLGRESLQRIGKNLGTDLVVVGSYATLRGKDGGSIRLDLRLLDTRNGEIVDALSETGTQANLFDLVSRGGEHLRNKLGVRSTTKEEAAQVAFALPSSTEAARLYSEGLAKLRVFDALAAKTLMSQAVTAEPDFALSHLALGAAWKQCGYDEKAKLEAKRAFDLSSNLSRAERLLVDGNYREASGDWDKAIEIYHALIEFFPDNLDYGLALVNAQLNANRWKDALATVAGLQSLPAPLRDDARIYLAEGAAARSLGDMKRAQAAMAKAAESARASGASLLLARARLDQAWVFENLGKFEEAAEFTREAKQLYLTAQDRRGIAKAATLEGIVLENQGDYAGAKKKFEESLAIHRDVGDRLGVANSHDNVGEILFDQGDLSEAHRSYQETLQEYEEIGDQDGVALAKIGLGEVAFSLGKHAEAKALFVEAQEICRQIGDRGREAEALSHLGRTLQIEGNFEEARKNEAAAMATFEAMGDTPSAMQAHLGLAELSLDEGKIEEALAEARRAGDFFKSVKASRDQALADGVLSRSFLAQGKIPEATDNLKLALTLTKESPSPELELFTAIIAARVKAASGRAADSTEAARDLSQVIANARAAGFMNVTFEARLTLAEIEMNSGDAAKARLQLEALKKEASDGGFFWIARRADTTLKTGHGQIAMM